MNAGIIFTLTFTSLVIYFVHKKFKSSIQPVTIFLVWGISFLTLQYVLLVFTPLHSLVPEKILLKLEVLENIESKSSCDIRDDFDKAHAFFSDKIDFSKVKLYKLGDITWINLPARLLQPSIDAVAWGNYVYVLDRDLCNSSALFVHELTHVWQYQQGMGFGLDWIPKWVSYYWLYFTDFKSLYDYGGLNGLLEAKSTGKAFEDFNLEQQAAMAGDLYFIEHSALQYQYYSNVTQLHELLNHFVTGGLNLRR